MWEKVFGDAWQTTVKMLSEDFHREAADPGAEPLFLAGPRPGDDVAPQTTIATPRIDDMSPQPKPLPSASTPRPGESPVSQALETASPCVENYKEFGVNILHLLHHRHRSPHPHLVSQGKKGSTTSCEKGEMWTTNGIDVAIKELNEVGDAACWFAPLPL